MANTIHFQLRGDIAENWESKNPVLFRNEPGFDMTSGRLKMGDGVTAWNDLPYLKTDITGRPIKITYDDGVEAALTWEGMRIDSITQVSDSHGTKGGE